MPKLDVHFDRTPFRLLECSDEDLEILSLFHWYLLAPVGAGEKSLRRARLVQALQSSPETILPMCKVRLLTKDNKREVRPEKLVLYNLEFGPAAIVTFFQSGPKGKTHSSARFLTELSGISLPKFIDENPLNVRRENLWHPLTKELRGEKDKTTENPQA